MIRESKHAMRVAVYARYSSENQPAILGHSTLSTSERHYNQARGLEAGRRYHGTRNRAKPTRDHAHLGRRCV